MNLNGKDFCIVMYVDKRLIGKKVEQVIDEKKLIEEMIPLLNEHGDMYLAGQIIVLIDSQPKIDCLYCTRREWYQKGYQDGLNADKWIPCEVEMPKEHESMFAKFKGTNKWSGGMFEKTSDEVNVTIELDDGSRITRTTHTIDGKWSVEINSWVKQKVIAWQPLPQPYKKEGAE